MKTRRRLERIVLAALVLLLVAVAAWRAWGVHRLEQEVARLRAEAARAEAEHESREARGIDHALAEYRLREGRSLASALWRWWRLVDSFQSEREAAARAEARERDREEMRKARARLRALWAGRLNAMGVLRR